MTLPDTSKCLVLRRESEAITSSVEQLRIRDFPNEGDALVRVAYSGINYKDALAVTGRGKIIRGEYPFVPGIDLVGTILESDSSMFSAGDAVIGTGWGLGEDRWGGYSEYQRVPSRTLVQLPDGMEQRAAAAAGTAGLTAMLSALSIVNAGVKPDDGDVAVTGASGGVGSLSILFLSKMGYRVVASTGKQAAKSYLHELGAAEIIDRSILAAGPVRPLDSGRWAAAIDSVGGSTLSAILSAVRRHGVVASCGLVAGADLNTTVYPFILRGVSLVGIDSNTCPGNVRETAWARIAETLGAASVARISSEIALEQVPAESRDVLAGRVQGRLVVNLTSLSE